MKINSSKNIIIKAIFFAIFLVASIFCVNLVVLNVFADDYNISLTAVSGDGSASNPYVIDSSDDLTYMATQCNNNAGNYRTAYYVQTGNLTCPSWTSISSFSGNYDGRGYTISGLSTSSTNFAFFTTLESSAVIKNVGFTNVSYNVSAKGDYSNAVIAINNYGTISNCFVSGTLSVKAQNGTEKRVYVGGLVAYMGGGSINNCYNAANISIDAPGIYTTTCYIGGIACRMANGTINNCYNIGNLYIDYSLYWVIGGIAAKDDDGGALYNCAVLRDSCEYNGSKKNSFFNRYSGSTDISTSNCGVYDSATLKNSGASPLSSWEWNTSNNFPRTWGFAPSSSSYYNSGYPALRVFYESFTVNVYDEAGSSLLATKTTRYPYYSVSLADVTAPAKRGHTFVGKFTNSPNSTGSVYSGTVSSICTNLNFYATYDVNYYRLRITNPTPLAGTVTLRDEMIAFGSLVTLTATENEGYRFVDWRFTADNSLASDQNPCVFNMQDYDIIAYSYYMQETYAVKVYVNDLKFGSVSGQYDYFTVGQSVTLTASANLGYEIDKFYLSDGTTLSSTSTYSFTMPRQNLEIYVDFKEIYYNLTVQTYPAGLASVTGAGQYKYGDEVDLSVSNVQSGYKFASWKLSSTSAVSFGVQENAKFTMPASNSTIYCYLIAENQNYVAFLNKNQEVVAEHVVSDGASVAMQSDLTLDGYNFLGWFDDGTQVTSLTSVTENVILQATYEKIFDCEVDISVVFRDENYSTSENFAVFLTLTDEVGNKFNLSVDIISQVRFNLINSGVYGLSFVLPTYHDADIYLNNSLLTSSNFEVSNDDELVEIQIVAYKNNDYLLYDSEFVYGENVTSEVQIISPISEVAGESSYVGIEPILSNYEFGEFNEPVSPYGYELKDVIGATNWGGMYNFTNLNYLQEGANFVGKDLGSSVYKVSLANHYQSMYPFNTDWGDESINNMTDLAKSKPYKEMFENEFIETYILVAYEFVYCPWERVLTNAYTLSDMEIYYEMVRQEFADLTKYLLSTYAQSGKTFILSNWEGDNAYGTYYDMCSNDTQRQLLTDAYVGYINARQDGIIAGRTGLVATSQSSKVYGNFEVNHIGQNIPNVPNRWRLVDVAVPKTYCDLYSISDWYSYLQDDSGNYTFPLQSLLDQLYSAAQNNLSNTDPTNYPQSTFTGGKNIMVTEFGYDENTDSKFYERIVHEVESAIEWGVYKLVYWGAYSNVKYVSHSNRPKNEEMQGLWLIKPDGSFSQAFWYLKSVISSKDYVNSTPNIIFKVNGASGINWDYYKDKIIFKDDLVDASKVKSYSSNITLYSFETTSDNYYYFQEFNYHYGTVDTTGIIQSSDDDSFKYITYDMISNNFGILLYNYNLYDGYSDLDGNKIESLVVIEGKNKAGYFEKIENVHAEYYTSSRSDGSLYWMQTYLSCSAQVGKYSELRISFANKNYNSWDPIITSVVFFEGGEA